jgi:hypothetical protein
MTAWQMITMGRMAFVLLQSHASITNWARIHNELQRQRCNVGSEISRVDARAPKGAKHQSGPQATEAGLQCGSGQSEWRPHCSKATRASARVAVINSGIGTDSLGPCARPASPGP